MPPPAPVFLPRPANDNPTPARQRRRTVQTLPIVGRIVDGGVVVPLKG